jgi:hypothetical protein
MGWGRYASVFAAVSVVAAISACGGGPVPARHPVMLSFVNADGTTAIAGSYVDVHIFVDDSNATIREKGKMPDGLLFRAARAGSALLVGRLGSGAGGQYPLDLTTSGAGTYAFQRFTLSVNQRPAFPSGDLRSMVFPTGGNQEEQFVVVATGYPVPTITEYGTLQSGRSFQAIPGGAAQISGSPPGLWETPCNSQIRLVATNSVGTATMNLEVKLKNFRCGFDISVFFSTLKGAIVYGPPIVEAGRAVGHWIVEAGKKIGRLISRNGKTVVENVAEDSGDE